MVDDFNIRFGSNAKAFSTALIRDLQPARTELTSFLELLNRVNSATAGAGRHNAPSPQTPARNPGGGATSGIAAPSIDLSKVERDIESMTGDLNGMLGKLGSVIQAMGRAVPGIENFVKQKNYSEGAKGKYAAGTDTARGKGGQYSSDPSAVRDSQRWALTTRSMEQLIKDARRTRDDNLSKPAKVDFSGITKLQLDQAGFDRVVNKLEEIKTALNARGGTGRVAKKVAEKAESAQAETTTSKKSGKKAGKVIQDEVAVTAKEMADLRKELADAQQQLIKTFGGEAPAQLTNALGDLRAKLAAQEAKVDRATRGVSRTTQSAERVAEAEAERKKFKDIDRAEYDARKRNLKLIQNAGRTDFAELATRRGQGGISHKDLIETAQAFQGQGFDVKYGSKTTKAQLAERIISARQAFEAEHGTDIPDSLRVGAPPRGPDTVSPEMKNLIGDQRSAAQIAEERHAREVRRIAYLSGNLPPEETLRGTGILPGSINVPPGMVKGGSYTDAYGFLEHTKMLDQRALGRAAVRASDPGFNPFAVREKDHISGSGDVAKDAKEQFRELKRATRELDTLGRDYDDFANAIVENQRFIERVEARIGTPHEKSTDREKLAGAQQQVQNAQNAMASQRFKGLQDLFENPEYQAGRRMRDITREKQQAEAEERAANRPENISNAGALAVAGGRTAIGSKTRIYPVPGLRPLSHEPDGTNHARGDAFRFEDSERNPKELLDLNRAWRRARRGFERAAELAKDLEAGTEGITQGHVDKELKRAENNAGKFLNQVNKLFGAGVAPGYQPMFGTEPQTKEGIAGEARRQAERIALAQRAASKPRKPTDVETAVQRSKDVERTKKLLAKADEELTAAEKAETAAVKAAAKAKSARPKAEQEAIDARTAASNRLAALNFDNVGAQFPDVVGSNRRKGDGAQVNTRVRSSLLLDKAPRDLTPEEANRVNDYREAMAQQATKRALATHTLEELPKVDLTPEEEAASKASNAAATAKARRDSIATALKAREAREAAAQENVGGKEPEVKNLQRRLTRSQNLRRELGTLKAAVRKAVAAEDEEAVAEARAERDAFKAKNQRYLLTRAEQKVLRQRIAGLNAAGGGEGGGGGNLPTASGAGGSGGGGSTNNLLRQILASVNAIRDRVRTGRGGAGRAIEDGEVAPRPTTRGRRLLEMSQAVDKETGLPDDRTRAKAAAEQQRDIERMQRAGILKQTVARAQDQATKINEAATRSAEQATRRSTEADRAKARTAQTVAATLARVTGSAREEVQALEQLTRAGSSNEKITEQQARAYAALNKALADAGVQPGGERHKQIRDVLSSANVSKSGRQTNISGSEADDIRRSAANINGFEVVDKSMAGQVPPQGIFGEQSAFTKAMFGNHGFWSRVMASTGTFVVRNFTAGFVFGLTNALQQIIKMAITTESTFIRVSDALEQTGRSSGNLRTQLQGISSQYGTNLEDVYQTAAGLVGLFNNINDIAGATKVVSELQMISGGALNAQEAMGSLASITGAYGDQLQGGVDGLSQVADVLTVVQNVIGTNIETTAEGVASLSGLSKQLKISFQDTAVYVAQIAKLTNQTGAASGEQFGRILAQMQTGRGRTALTRALPGSGIDSALGSGNYGQALQILLKNWDNLTDAQQRNIATAVAGQRQARAFAALTANTTKTLNAQAQAHDANGQAQKRAEAIARQLNVQMQKLGSNFQNFAQNLIRMGVLDFMGVLLKVTNNVLAVVNKLLSTFNDFADQNAMTKFLKNAVAGLLGLVVAMKVGTKAFAGFRASIATMKASEGVVGAGMMAASETATVSGRQVITAPGRYVSGKLETLGRQSRLERLMAPYSARERDLRAGPVERTAPLSSRAADNASRGLTKVNSGLGRLAEMGPVASLGLLGIFTVITAGIDSLRKSAALGNDLTDLYKSKYNSKGQDRSRASATQSELTAEYVGPFTEKYRNEVVKGNRGLWSTATRSVGEGIRSLNPSNFFSVSGYKRNITQGVLPGLGSLPFLSDAISNRVGVSTGSDGAYASWKGKLPQRRKNELAVLGTQQQDLLSRTNQAAINDMYGGLLPTLKVPKDVAEKAGKGAEALAKNIATVRASVEKDKSLSAEQRAHILSELEGVQKNLEDKIASIQLTAEGVKNVDQLTTEQLNRVGQMSDMFGSLASSGSGIDAQNPAYKKLFQSFMADTGVRPQSAIGQDLTKLMNGRLTKSQVLITQMSDQDKVIQQYAARYSAQQKAGAEQADLDQTFSTLTQLIQARASELATLLQSFFDDANALSDGLAASGKYGLAAGTLRGAGASSAAHRNRRQEDPVIRAQRDQAERQAYEQSATIQAQGQNAALQTAKARGVGAQKSARLDEQIARNSYSALLDARAAAKAVGAAGPSVDAIHQAKMNWLQSQRSSATAAQDANIAQMTAAAAGIWNSVAAASAQEGIALQQYANAKKNFGANSTEALNALAQYKGSQKATIQAQDQVAESRRQAMLAGIPQGNAVAVSRAQLASAHAAVAAARKYGVNSTEYQGALATLYSTQQQAVSAQSAVTVAQAQLAQAYATARGDTVGAARAGERVARAQLAAAKKASGGANSADVLAARAGAIQARATTRDAILQDRLDTIDFNLQMGKTTHSSAIAAMQQILRTANLTKQQRRDLLLKIKGMKAEIADGPWNFESVGLPTPYQMRRYVAAEAMNAAQKKMTPYRDSTSLNLRDRPSRAGEPGAINDNRTVMINGADTQKVRKILEEILGNSVKTRTAQGRRR